MPEQKNPQLASYFELIDRSESLAFWLGVDGIRMTGLTASLLSAVYEAQNEGLSEHVIKTAVQIGEFRGQTKKPTRNGEKYPLLHNRLQPDYAANEPHPVVWVTQNQLADAFAGFDEEIDSLSDYQRIELIQQVGEAMHQVYLTLLPDILVQCLNDLPE